MKKVILYIAQSLDGYIARKNKSVDWLEKYFNKEMAKDYKTFFNKIDTVVVGNTTHKQFPQKYEGKPTFIFSRKQKGTDENLTYIKGNVNTFIKKYNPKGNVWVIGGSDIISQFLKEDLIDEMRIFTMPELSGNGIPLFKESNTQRKFKLITTITHGKVVEVRYKK